MEIRRIKQTTERSDRPGRVTHERMVACFGGEFGVVIFRWRADPDGSLQAEDLAVHSRVPLYEGMRPMERPCHQLAATCYYDGTSLGADEMLRSCVIGGIEDEAIFRELERMARRTWESRDGFVSPITAVLAACAEREAP